MHAFDRQTDGQTEISSIDRVCIACSVVKFFSICFYFVNEIWHIQTPHLVQLMNIVSNDYIFDCNNRDANRAFVIFRENTAPVATTGISLLNAKFTFNGTSPDFCTDSSANERLTTLSLIVFTERNLLGATRKNRSKIGDFAPTRTLLLKISGRRGRPLQ